MSSGDKNNIIKYYRYLDVCAVSFNYLALLKRAAFPIDSSTAAGTIPSIEIKVLNYLILHPRSFWCVNWWKLFKLLYIIIRSGVFSYFWCYYCFPSVETKTRKTPNCVYEDTCHVLSRFRPGTQKEEKKRRKILSSVSKRGYGVSDYYKASKGRCSAKFWSRSSVCLCLTCPFRPMRGHGPVEFYLCRGEVVIAVVIWVFTWRFICMSVAWVQVADLINFIYVISLSGSFSGVAAFLYRNETVINN